LISFSLALGRTPVNRPTARPRMRD